MTGLRITELAEGQEDCLNAIKEVVLDLNEALVEVGRVVIWKAKEADYWVRIVGDLGVGPDGRRYVAVENACTGIPFDELEI